MKDFIVTKREVWTHGVRIRADNKAAAIEAVRNGEGEEVDDLEYSRTLDDYTVEEDKSRPSSALVKARIKLHNKSPYVANFSNDDMLVVKCDEEDAVMEIQLLLGNEYEIARNESNEIEIRAL
jgi:hypothetical protein